MCNIDYNPAARISLESAEFILDKHFKELVDAQATSLPTPTAPVSICATMLHLSSYWGRIGQGRKGMPMRTSQ